MSPQERADALTAAHWHLVAALALLDTVHTDFRHHTPPTTAAECTTWAAVARIGSHVDTDAAALADLTQERPA